MSNPLAVFRKNRNYWMAGLVILAIMAFVVAPAIEQLSQAYRTGGGGENAVVVRWDGGKMTMAEVQHATAQHGRLVRFLRALGDKVREAGGEPDVPGAGMNFDPQTGQPYYSIGINMVSDEEMICRSRILATHAKKMGVQLTDQTADDFLEAFCDGKISAEDYEKTLTETTSGQLSEFEIREILKTEIATNIAFEMGRSALEQTTPGKMWRDFLKLNQTAKVTAFPVFVDEYVAKVEGSPTETEIQAIYEDGIKRAPNPNSSEPGFVRRYQSNLEYLQANFQDWVEREKANVTEEQARAEYDRLVELKMMEVPAETPSSETPATETPATETPATETPATETPATETPATETPATETPATETPATETPATETPATETTPTETTAPQTPATESPATESPATESPATEPAGPASGDQSQNLNSTNVRLVALVQDAETQAGSPAGESESVGAQPPAESTELEGESAQAATSNTPPPVVQPPQLGESDATPPAATGESLAQAVPTMRTRTFEEAKDEITEQLARTAAVPKFEEVLTQAIQEEMTPYYHAFREYQAFQQSGVDASEAGELPPRPDLKKYAEANNLIYGETGMVDAMQLSRTPFGLSQMPRDAQAFSGMVASTMMEPQVAPFIPLQSNYFDQAASQMSGRAIFSQWVFWKTAERPAYIPDLTEVREEVIEAWKRVQARDLAKQAAEAIAKKVSTAGSEPWQSTLSATEQALLVETDPFPWMSRLGNQPDVTVVPKLDNIGEDFMKAVFDTPVGQTGVAPNAAKGIYYAFRVVEKGPTEEDLRDRFNADPQKSGPLSIGRVESQRLFAEWYESLDRELGVEWMIPINSL
ncbi:MAG: hypothetical protein R3C53_11935 [Pirellulaceae bacterium]